MNIRGGYKETVEIHRVITHRPDVSDDFEMVSSNPGVCSRTLFKDVST